MIKKGTWVRIESVVLTPDERADNIPEETKQVPLKMWLKGRLLKNSNIGEEVDIFTKTGRFVTGILDEVHPTYSHNYGDFVPEILMIDDIINYERDVNDE